MLLLPEIYTFRDEQNYFLVIVLAQRVVTGET